MNFKDYVKGINELLESNPELGEHEAIASKDDEGNGYNRICYIPSVGAYDGEDFTEANSEDFEDGMVVNSVCVN